MYVSNKLAMMLFYYGIILQNIGTIDETPKSSQTTADSNYLSLAICVLKLFPASLTWPAGHCSWWSKSSPAS